MLKRLNETELSTYRFRDEFGAEDRVHLGLIAEELPPDVLSKDGKGVDVFALLTYTFRCYEGAAGMD